MYAIIFYYTEYGNFFELYYLCEMEHLKLKREWVDQWYSQCTIWEKEKKEWLFCSVKQFAITMNKHFFKTRMVDMLWWLEQMEG